MGKYNFFRSENERNLWIKLKGGFIQEFQKRVNKYNHCLESCIETATNQFEYDEEHGRLRITLDELFMFDYEQYETRLRENHKKWCEIFGKLVGLKG